MQLIYLGEVTFPEERMDEFIAVAKSLEIKELCSAETKTNDNPDAEKLESDPVRPNDKAEEHTVKFEGFKLCQERKKKRRCWSK